MLRGADTHTTGVSVPISVMVDGSQCNNRRAIKMSKNNIPVHYCELIDTTAPASEAKRGFSRGKVNFSRKARVSCYIRIQ